MAVESSHGGAYRKAADGTRVIYLDADEELCPAPEARRADVFEPDGDGGWNRIHLDFRPPAPGSAPRPLAATKATGRLNFTADGFRRFLAGVRAVLLKKFGIDHGKKE